MQFCMSDKHSTQFLNILILVLSSYCIYFLIYRAPLFQLLIIVLRNVKWDNVCEG